MYQVITADVAQPDAFDQPVVAGGDHDRQLLVEQLVRAAAVHQPQVDRRQSVDAEGAQVGFDVTAQVGWFFDSQPAALVVAATADLADQREVGRVGVQGLADQFVGHIRPIELGGIDVIDTEFDGPPEHRQRLGAVARRAESPGTGELNGAKTYASDGKATKLECLHRTRLASCYGYFSCAGSSSRW